MKTRRRPQAKPAPTRRPQPKAVPLSWAALAGALTIDAATVFRYRHQPGAPTEPDVAAWRAFLATRSANGHSAPKQRSPAELEREQADLRYARARAEREERENAISAGIVVTKAQALEAAGAVRDAFIAEGETLAGAVLSLVPKLARSEKDAVENAVRSAWQAACMRISAGMRHA